jgi:7-carboxy-7-deazaguanine synthase
VLRLTEIFYSLQGESTLIGLPTVFIRLTGCPLRCQYCDTEYAFNGGKKRSIPEILEEVYRYEAQYVTVTGGEPLAQKECIELMDKLVETHTVSLETSGAMDISKVNSKVIRIVDIKTPGSKESDKNLLENLQYLTSQDQLKFVICSQADYNWSKAFLAEHNLYGRCHILFSPSYHEIQPQALAEWILSDRLNVRMQVQLHKIIWGEKAGV